MFGPLAVSDATATLKRVLPLLVFLGFVVILTELTAKAEVFDVVAGHCDTSAATARHTASSARLVRSRALIAAPAGGPISRLPSNGRSCLGLLTPPPTPAAAPP